MKSKKYVTHYLVTSALIAAAYAALTFLSSALGLAYGSIQFRLSEVLNVLALFTPAAVPGLTLGCLLGNITSPFGILDIVVGTLATFLSAVSIRLLSCMNGRFVPFLSVIPPTVFNSVLVGGEIAWFLSDGVGFAGFFVFAAQVAVGEVVVCGLAGVPIYFAAKKYVDRFKRS